MRQAKLKTLLYVEGISQKTLAQHVGISERAMCQKINGTHDFTFTEIYRICELLGIKNPLDVFETK